MAERRSESAQDRSKQASDIAPRLCTWCQVPMTARLVGGGHFIHYTCPKCIFQHTSKRAQQET